MTLARTVIVLEGDDLDEATRESDALLASLSEGEVAADLDDPAYLESLRGDTWWYEPESADAVNAEVGGVPVRIFQVEEPVGVYVRIHGGGFVYGSAGAEDTLTWRIARTCSLTVLSVEYRLAPEHPWPEPNDDCYAVARWARENAQEQYGTSNVFVGGESSGAHLALGTALRLRDSNSKARGLAGINLVGGVYDLRGVPSTRQFRGRDPLGLSERVVDWYARNYAGPAGDFCHPEISPLWADLHGLPPTLVSTGAHDPLVDHSLFLVERLAFAGVPVALDVYREGYHGFELLNSVLARRCADRLAGFIESCVGESPRCRA